MYILIKSIKILRRRRAEASVELRKIKKIELLAKRRNIQETKNSIYRKFTPTFHKCSSSGISNKIRQKLVDDETATVSEIIKSETIPFLIECLTCSESFFYDFNISDYKIQLEASWALTNITSGDHESTKAVVDCGVVPVIVERISKVENVDVLAQYVWILSNIMVMESGVNCDNFYSALRTIGNIVMGSDSDTQMVIDEGGLSVFMNLLPEVDKSLKAEVVWILSNVAAGNNKIDFLSPNVMKIQNVRSRMLVQIQNKSKSRGLVAVLKKEKAENWADILEKKEKESAVPKMDDNADPQANLMNMMQKMYEEGDDEMKRTMNKL
ncbi:importin subunit alpha-1-like, partial [Octopus sinensis]|uniref:Importin subunit alpha-1-like n=1 Tax=Octopus sinensis TaxID=2607531 RepID=A0A6P7U8D8_9MOLL